MCFGPPRSSTRLARFPFQNKVFGVVLDVVLVQNEPNKHWIMNDEDILQ